jgi:hypothetical protein
MKGGTKLNGFKLLESQITAVKKLHAIDENYSFDDLMESNFTTEEKIQIIYNYGKKFGYGQSAAWTEGIEHILSVLDMTVKGINY